MLKELNIRAASDRCNMCCRSAVISRRRDLKTPRPVRVEFPRTLAILKTWIDNNIFYRRYRFKFRYAQRPARLVAARRVARANGYGMRTARWLRVWPAYLASTRIDRHPRWTYHQRPANWGRALSRCWRPTVRNTRIGDVISRGRDNRG